MPCKPEAEVGELTKWCIAPMKPIAALILAAGEAARFGACKQLTDLDGTTMLQRSIDKANEIFPGAVFVVTGAYHREISAAIQNANIIHNSNWRQGIGCSIACGVRVIEDQYDAIMILLADQITIEASQLKVMVSSFNGSNIVCARYAGSRGVPALFNRAVFGKLKALKADRGAKALLNQPNEDIVDIEIFQADIDIDTPSDLEQWKTARRRTIK